MGHLAWLTLDFSSAQTPGVTSYVFHESCSTCSQTSASSRRCVRPHGRYSRLNVEHHCEPPFCCLLHLRCQSSPPPGDTSPHPRASEPSSCGITLCVTHTRFCRLPPSSEHDLRSSVACKCVWRARCAVLTKRRTGQVVRPDGGLLVLCF